MIEEEEAARPQRRKEEENGAVMELANRLLAMKLEKQGLGAAQPQQEGEWEVTAQVHVGTCFCPSCQMFLDEQGVKAHGCREVSPVLVCDGLSTDAASSEEENET